MERKVRVRSAGWNVEMMVLAIRETYLPTYLPTQPWVPSLSGPRARSLSFPRSPDHRPGFVLVGPLAGEVLASGKHGPAEPDVSRLPISSSTSLTSGPSL